MWLIFTIAFSCYLRVEINSQLTRQVFWDSVEAVTGREQNNTSSGWRDKILLINETDGEAGSHHCIKVINETAVGAKVINGTRLREEEYHSTSHLARLLSFRNTTFKICHPNKGAHQNNSSLVIFFMLLVMVSVWFLSVAILTCYHKYQSNTYHGLKRLYKLATVIIILSFTFWTDIQDIKHEPAAPFTHFDDGFVLIEYFILHFALLFIFWLFDKMITLRLWSSFLLDPEVWFQGFACVAAIFSVFMKNSLTNSGKGPASGMAAIGIALTWLLIILKIGRYSQEGIGNFATMFHLVLKKLRLYMFTVVILLFGFAFGFWVINHHDAQQSDNGFGNFIRSIKSAFIMFFGEFGEFGNVLHYSKEIAKSHFITLAAFLILFLMMITISSLGMLNLLIAAVIVDYKQNQEEVHYENLAYMAQFAVMVDRGVIRRSVDAFRTQIKLSESPRGLPRHARVTYCRLELCSSEGDQAEHVHLEHEFLRILQAGRPEATTGHY